MHTGQFNLSARPGAVLTVLLMVTIGFFLVHGGANTAFGQVPSPTPAASTGNPLTGFNRDPPRQNRTFAENIAMLHEYSYRFLQRMIEVVERPSYASFEFLAQVLAGLILLFSFLRLIRENDGASKELYYWLVRASICLAFLSTGPYLINSLGSIGISIARPTQDIKLNTENTFNTDYSRFVVGNFMLDPAKVTELMPERGPVGVLKAGAGLKISDMNQQLDMNNWSLPTLFMGLNISRGILAFADLFLLLLVAFIAIALRLAVPFAIAIAIDQKLAQRITYPFAWGTIVLTVITPVIVSLIGVVAYGAADIAVLAGDRQPVQVDPTTFRVLWNSADASQYTTILAIGTMLIASLSLFAAPYIAYRISTGQVFEAISSTAAGWMAAIVGSGVEYVGLKAGASLQRQAENTQTQGAYQAELLRVGAARDAGNTTASGRLMAGIASAKSAQTAGNAGAAGSLITQSMNATAQANYGNRQITSSRNREVTDTQVRTGQTTTSLENSRERQLTEIEGNRDADKKMVWAGIYGRGGEFIGRQIGSGQKAGIIRRGVGVASEAAGGAMQKYTELSAVDVRAGANTKAANQYTSSETQNVNSAAQQLIVNQQNYAEQMTGATGVLAADQTNAAKAGYDTQIRGNEEASRINISGQQGSYAKEVEANQIQFNAGNQVAAINLGAALEASRQRALASVITGITRDIGRRVEEGMRAATRY